jgi:molybdate/tungstate transport system substrate-binding protein
MVEQRSRRAFVAGLAGAGAVGTAALGSGQESVAVLCAGSLARTVEAHVGPAFEAETGIAVHGEYYGSNAVVRMVEDRTKHPDVVLSADAALLRDRLYGTATDWDVAVATNTLGIAYDAETAFGRRLAAGESWHAVALDAMEGEMAISDPDLDPLGYRAIMAFELAERAHGPAGLRVDLVDAVYREPEEPQLLAGVESGARASAVVYRNMALDHGLSFVVFPDSYNFGNPAFADHYATVSFRTDEGYTAIGRPILYNATVIDRAKAPEAGRRLVQFLADRGDVLADAGLSVGRSLPRGHGAVPSSIEL